MTSFLKNDIVHFFSIGFTMGTVALFMAQPAQERGEILQQLHISDAAHSISTALKAGIDHIAA